MNNKYFGVMLDMSRNAVMKPEEVMNFAKTISSFGYNMIQLYTEDTYEVKEEPYFGYMRGKYTIEEIKQIDKYCKSINVELIPCIQTLAHLNCIFKWGEYSPINDYGDILLVDEDRTYQLIENMFKSLREAYSTKIVHIGMDEAHMIGLGKYLDKYGYKNRFEILNKHLSKVVAIAEKYNFKPMIWSDMYFRLANQGNYYSFECNIDERILDQIPKNVDLVYWDYYHNKKSEYTSMINAHKKFKNNIWFAGGAWTWVGFAPYNRLTLKNMKAAMQSCKETGIENIIVTMWGDDGKECSFYSVLPALYAIKKYYDGVTDIKEIKSLFKLATGEEFDGFVQADLPNMICDNKDSVVNPCKAMLFNDLFFGFLDSTVFGDAKKEYKKYERKLSAYAKKSNYGYIFDCLSKLCGVLSIKYDLGLRIRKAYKEKDMEKLKIIIEDIKKVEFKVEKFYKSFKILWMKENKPNGFEVQEQRIGGLKLRLRSCRERLIDFVNDGKDIPELKEDILDYFCDAKREKELVCLNSWISNVSTSQM